MFRVQDMPTELREAIGPASEPEPAGEQSPTARPRRRFTSSEAQARAFDLEDEGSPDRRSGVKLLNIDELLAGVEDADSRAD